MEYKCNCCDKWTKLIKHNIGYTCEHCNHGTYTTDYVTIREEYDGYL